MHVTRSRSFVFCLLTFTMTVLACSSDGTDPMDDDNGGGEDGVQVISLTGSLTFSPSNVTISPGTTVRWVNNTDLGHTVTPTGHSEWSEWVTNSRGQTFEHTFASTGTFDYRCVPHLANGMTGRIIVQ